MTQRDFGPIATDLDGVADWLASNVARGISMSFGEQAQLLGRIVSIVDRISELENFQALRRQSARVIRAFPALSVIEGGRGEQVWR